MYQNNPLPVSHHNWNYCRYSLPHSGLRAFITFEMDQNHQEFYRVCLGLPDQHGEVFSKAFQELDPALNFLNRQYGHYPIEDLSQKNSEGCSSCAAH